MTCEDYDPGPDIQQQDLDLYEPHHDNCQCKQCTYEPSEEGLTYDIEDAWIYDPIKDPQGGAR